MCAWGSGVSITRRPSASNEMGCEEEGEGEEGPLPRLLRWMFIAMNQAARQRRRLSDATLTGINRVQSHHCSFHPVLSDWIGSCQSPDWSPRVQPRLLHKSSTTQASMQWAPTCILDKWRGWLPIALG